MSTTTLDRPPAAGPLRDRALAAAAQGRYDEAATLLEAALAKKEGDEFELLADLAAVHFRAGELVPAIALARHVTTKRPEHDQARFTLGMSLAAIGSHAEALEWLESLNQGERGARFHATMPALAGIVATEAARLHPLRSASPVATKAHTSTDAHKYDFSHLVQPPHQMVGGPIQDDEALLLYSVVRTMRLRRILELGGLSGYSARNFLAALAWDVDTAVYTCDLNPVPSQAPNHHTICKDATLLTAAELHDRPLDLVFFDCHVYDAQMSTFANLVNKGLITDATVIALHDTGLHPQKFGDWCYAVPDDTNGTCGYVHQDVERRMVNTLHTEFGYDAFCAHTDVRRHDERLPFRHGLTLMKKFAALRV